MFFSILIFFIIVLGFGHSVSWLFKLKYSTLFEYVFSYVGLGLITFTLLSTMLNLIHFPLEWWTFAIFAILGPLLTLWDKAYWKNVPLKVNWYHLAIIIITVAFFLVYLKGATGYFWLEDDDSWSHALATSYIATEHTAWDTPTKDFHYLDPYPPAYDIMMGLLHQVNNSVNWTLKFFNVLIIALGLPLAYLFFNRFFGSDLKASIATLCLAVIPGFMSHFTWAQSLGLILFFPALYWMHRFVTEEKHFWVTSICIAAVFVSQPSAAVIFLAFAGLFALCYSYRAFIPLAVGGTISGIYWFSNFAMYGVSKTLTNIGLSAGLLESKTSDTSGGIVYSFNDFAFPPVVSKMDQPTGIGIVLCILVVIGVTLLIINHKKLYAYRWYALGLFVFTFLGTEGNLLPFKLFPHRFWVFLSIAVAILAAEAIYILSDNRFRWFIIIPILVAIIWTSGYPKYMVETSMWPAGVLLPAPQEVGAWKEVQGIVPKNSQIYLLDGLDNRLVPGFDFFSPSWREGYNTILYSLNATTVKDWHNNLKSAGYEYIAVGVSSVFNLKEIYSQDDVMKILNTTNQLAVTYQYTPVYNSQYLGVFKIT